ncbi:hypothetical protein Hypma_016146 [Hypsizygus marmoreus]|uniref:Uncharacterized protein n=1 Tax=Hypsizygus marmoreus TaxID=39966 RepID=A0A369IYX7_HYPMA|nr:hypothetical protein Hypma_016146 [Hypsizygus marmoreus]
MQKTTLSGTAFDCEQSFLETQFKVLSTLKPLKNGGGEGFARNSWCCTTREQGTLLIENVDLHDRPLLLELEQRTYKHTLSENHWARVKRGRYKHDLCLIRRVDSHSFRCDVTLVPRLPLSKKRKRKSPPRSACSTSKKSVVYMERRL